LSLERVVEDLNTAGLIRGEESRPPF